MNHTLYYILCQGISTLGIPSLIILTSIIMIEGGASPRITPNNIGLVAVLLWGCSVFGYSSGYIAGRAASSITTPEYDDEHDQQEEEADRK